MIEGVDCSEEHIVDSAQKLKVCGHPLRLKILCLIERQDACVSELWQCLKQPQPVISQHLAVLKDRGIVESFTERNRRIYRISDEFIRKVICTMYSINVAAAQNSNVFS